MVSASKAARMAKRAEAGDKKSKKEVEATGEQPATTDEKMKEVEKLTQQMDKHGLSDRVTTGVLSSLPASRDVKITSASLVFHGKVLITDSTLELNFGRRYGLLGENGCGKSTILKSIAQREYPIPEHIDIYLLNEGAPPSDLGALEWVVREAQNQLASMEKKAEDILEENGPEDPILEDLYDVSYSLEKPLSLSLLVYQSGMILTSFTAYGQDGPLHLRDACFFDSDWSRFQQDHHPQEDQGYVRWLAYACGPCQGPLRQALAFAA
jgi:hypothetical protein